jgi:hypothetical protein
MMRYVLDTDMLTLYEEGISAEVMIRPKRSFGCPSGLGPNCVLSG